MNRRLQVTALFLTAMLALSQAAWGQFQKGGPPGSFAGSAYGYDPTGGYGNPYGGMDPAYGGYGPGYGNASGVSQLHMPLVGPLAVGVNGTTEGFGYEGAYFFAHQTVPLCTDPLHGWWLIDARGAISERGLPFTNIGVVRRTYFAPMCADVGLGVFFDYDGDKYEDFGHKFQQIGVSGHVWTQYFELNVNGYMPVGETAYLIGSETDPFYQNLLVVQRGIDSALEGFDIEVGLRPNFMQQKSGVIYLGGYAYDGDGIDPFGGFQMSFAFQPKAGWTLTTSLTTDDQFDTTGALQLEWNWGSSRGYSPTGRDLDPIRRKAHIVRANQTPVFGSDPDTGLLYRVLHVDNSAPDNGEGTFESPFNELVDAENASLPEDIIFVRAGVSTDEDGFPADLTGYNDGIVLKNGQLFLGEGVAHTVPTIEVGDFTFFTGTPGILPTITNPNGPAVTLADRNMVAGFNMASADTGVFGDGVTDAEIRDNNVTDSEFNGIEVRNSTGEFLIARNTVDGSELNGVLFENNTGTLLAADNLLTNNGIGIQDGLRVYLNGGGAAAQLVASIIGNTFDGNGVGLFVGADGAGTVVTTTISQNEITNNRSNGLELDSRNDGHLNFFVTNNLINLNGQTVGGAGIRVGVFDATADGLIADNDIVDNIGAANIGPLTTNVPMGIGVSVFGPDGQLDLEIARNFISGEGLAATAGGDAITLDFQTTNAALVSTFNINNNIFSDMGSNVLDVNAEDNSRADIVFDDNLAVANDSGSNRGGGINITTLDTAVVRINATTNEFSDLTGGVLNEGAIALLSFNDSRIIANFISNTLDRNGGPEGLGVFTSDNSSIALEFINNRMIESAGDGADLVADDTSTLYAIFDSNEISGSGGNDFAAATVALSNPTVGIAFRNENVFAEFAQLSNNGPGAFFFETDGTSTPALPLILVPPVVQSPFGTIDPLIAPLQVFP